MLINYWNCKFADYDEVWDGETELRHYGCTHPDNKDRCCECDNKYCGDEAECPIAEKDNHE